MNSEEHFPKLNPDFIDMYFQNRTQDERRYIIDIKKPPNVKISLYFDVELFLIDVCYKDEISFISGTTYSKFTQVIQNDVSETQTQIIIFKELPIFWPVLISDHSESFHFIDPQSSFELFLHLLPNNYEIALTLFIQLYLMRYPKILPFAFEIFQNDTESFVQILKEVIINYKSSIAVQVLQRICVTQEIEFSSWIYQAGNNLSDEMKISLRNLGESLSNQNEANSIFFLLSQQHQSLPSVASNQPQISSSILNTIPLKLMLIGGMFSGCFLAGYAFFKIFKWK